MQGELEMLLAIVPALGTIILALLAGAGGSAVLELIWKPRRTRRRVATLIHADVMTNVQLIMAHAEVRRTAPRKIPNDMLLSKLGFATAGAAIAELDPAVLRSLVVYYNRVEEANRSVQHYADALDRLDTLVPGSSERAKIQRYLNSVVDAWNSGLDKLFETSQEIATAMEREAHIKSKKGAPIRDIAAEVRAFQADRAARLAALDAMDEEEDRV